jgi:hypothetical protein
LSTARENKRAARHQRSQRRADSHQLQQQRRGALRLDKDSLGRSNTNKRGPKSKDEGFIRRTTASPQQLAYRDLIAAGYSPDDARVEAGLPPLR